MNRTLSVYYSQNKANVFAGDFSCDRFYIYYYSEDSLEWTVFFLLQIIKSPWLTQAIKEQIYVNIVQEM